MKNDNTICVSFQGNIDAFREISKNYAFIEIRMDLCNFTDEQYREVFSADVTTIATCKSSNYMEQLKKAARFGADYIDIDITTDSFELLLDIARENSCKTILSYHNSELTPPRKRLLAMLARCAEYHADICKIVCMPLNIKDVLRMMRLYTSDELALAQDMKLISFAMNKSGRVSRIAAMELGAPFMYCAIDNEQRTAAGQFTADEFTEIMDLCI
jgi:3-dehydroquinate dehydratase type I